MDDDDEYFDCPDCGKHTARAKRVEEGWSGTFCTAPDCDWWFCY